MHIENQAPLKHFFKGTLNKRPFQDIYRLQTLFKTCENPVLNYALLLREICLPTEFQVDTFYSSHVIHGQSSKCKNKERTITPK